MSDIADSLLAQYYGISNEQKTKKCLSIHEVNDGANNADKLIGEQLPIDTNNDDVSEEMEAQKNDVGNVERNFKDNTSTQFSQILEQKELGNNNEISSELDILSERNTESKLCENMNPFPETNMQSALNSNKTISAILGLKDNDENNLYLSYDEDSLSDSASNVSSMSGKKKSTNTFLPVTPPPNKTPIYNETFIDLTNAGLVSFPIEMAEKYRTIRMLYLEDNSLCKFPQELFIILPHLQWLDIRNNYLTSLPTSIRSHPSLETILLQGNRIEKLPLELCLVPKLKTLNVAHNPIIVPPKDIIILGFSSILNYLRTEWNKAYPNESVTFIEQKIEPKLSTILCYKSPREKHKELSKNRQRMLKSTDDISNLFKGPSIRKKSNTYRPSNRYSNMQINSFFENSENIVNEECNDDLTNSLCTSCVRNLTAIQRKEIFNKYRKESGDQIHEMQSEKRDDRLITSCVNIKESCVRKEIGDIDNKILHLMGPSPRSCYVRQNVTELITYKHYCKKECKFRALSDEMKHIALAKRNNLTVINGKEKCRDKEHTELVFDIVTKDMQRMQLQPMQLKDPQYMLSCLEKYLGVKTN